MAWHSRFARNGTLSYVGASAKTIHDHLVSSDGMIDMQEWSNPGVLSRVDVPHRVYH